MSEIEHLSVLNPSTGEPITRLEQDTSGSAHAKLERAWNLFLQPSRHLPLHRRIEILECLAANLSAMQEALAIGIAEEGGKPLSDARVEASRAVAGVKSAIQTVSEHRGQVIPLGHQAASAGRLCFTQKFPRGVVLAFSAFNHPLNLIVHQVIPAFAAGCPCVVKPAPDTPLSCLRLVQAMREAGVPDDYIQAVITTDLETASQMVASDKIAFFSFIGSAQVGWMLRGKLHAGVRCALEHGGVAPCIVSESADLAGAVASITKGGFYHAGQVCVSTQRVFVAKACFENFVQLFTAAVRQLKVGDAGLADTEVGPLIRPGEVDRVDAWVQEAVALGARLVTGGKRLGGNFYQPTVLLDPPTHSRISCQEVFGPVVCVYSYEHLTQAFAAANLHPHAFQAAVYTSELATMNAAFQHLDASAVMVNDHTAFRDDVMPFAGLIASGLGVGGIPYTIEEMQFEKMLVIKQQP